MRRVSPAKSLRVGVDNDPTRAVASDRYCSLARHSAQQPALTGGPAPPALLPLGDVVQRVPLMPTSVVSNVSNVAPVTAVFEVPQTPKAVAPAFLPPMGADIKLASPPPGPRTAAGGRNMLTTSGFRARRQTATAAVVSKPVRPPVAPAAAEGAVPSRGFPQGDLRGYLVRAHVVRTAIPRSMREPPC